MSKIEEFLQKFDDQHLANLQCAAEDGRLVYMDSCNCLIHHFNGTYSETKWDAEVGPLARAAESEFLKMAPHEIRRQDILHGMELLTSTRPGDPKRRESILPLIHAEWVRRGRISYHDWRKIGQEFNEIAELTPVSPTVR